ncbi:MAG: hypothetical protein AAGA68_22515 [Pseudomonadota bacterium]
MPHPALRTLLTAALIVASWSAHAQDSAEPSLSYGQSTRTDQPSADVRELAAQYLALRQARTGTASEASDIIIQNRFAAAEEASDVAQDADRADPLASDEISPLSPTLGASFEGPSSDDNQSLNGFRVQPPDTNGDVGLNQVVSYNNLLFQVLAKDGTSQTLVPGNALFQGFGGPCEVDGGTAGAGDYIVLYDEGRWIYKGWAPNFGVECIAITDGEDALGNLTRYEFQVVPPGTFNDYPKLSVWASEDGTQSAYTLTERNFGIGFEISAYLIDRDAIRAGAPIVNFVRVSNLSFGNPDGIMPGHTENLSRAPGGACPLFSVAVEPTEYRFWEFCEDFPNGAGSFRRVGSVAVPTFDNDVADVATPGGGDALDTLSFFTAYRAVHSNIGGDHRLVLAHTVDLGGERAGVRWAILDVDDYDAISIIDTGTLGPNDGLERWMSSATLDTVGNLGIGYTRASGDSFPSVYVTGRETSDPAGTLQQEVSCVEGAGVQTGGIGRWGDYSTTSLDPADGCTFWSHQEYVASTGSFEWNTRWCSFRFASCTGEEPTDFTLLATDPGQAGVDNDFTTVNGTAGGAVLLYFGGAAGSTPISVGNCATSVDLANARLIGFGTDGDNDASVTITRAIPAPAAGRTLLFQAVDLRGCETSNVTTTTF